ncbi:MAG: flavin reductase family protein [Acidobacteria bacterium]|nr:flavin reductase family protein [Acidobacteriota bacterium]
MTATPVLPSYDGEQAALRRTFSHYPSGVVALIAEAEGLHSLVASTFTVGVSADPPLVSVAIQRTSTSWPTLRSAERIGVSVFAADQADLCRQLAGHDRARRFSDVPIRSTGTTARFIAGAALWFDCSLWNEVDAGDHTIALLEIRALGADHHTDPLVFHASAFRGLFTQRASHPAKP